MENSFSYDCEGAYSDKDFLLGSFVPAASSFYIYSSFYVSKSSLDFKVC
jgi:hypothetical protein